MTGGGRRVGAAWGKLEHAFRAVAQDIDRGMDVLSTHWNSDLPDTGGASAAFDYHIRKRWKPALEGLAQGCDARGSSTSWRPSNTIVVNTLLFALNFYATVERP